MNSHIFPFQYKKSILKDFTMKMKWQLGKINLTVSVISHKKSNEVDFLTQIEMCDIPNYVCF